jgi:hypothetical protein
MKKTYKVQKTSEEWDYIQHHEHMCEWMLKDENIIVWSDYIKNDINE